MNVAFGFKAHSGWAALVVLGTRDGKLEVADRRRVDLVADPASMWSKQPYHAAERLDPEAARALVAREIESARHMAVREMQAAVTRAQDAGQRVAACAVLVGDPMPEWSVDEILAVHFRMHKAEGVLFRDVLVRAAEACGLPLVAIPEKRLADRAKSDWPNPPSVVQKQLAALGKTVGAPWGKDQKDAALAALIALEQGSRELGRRV
jgi:hypothetical protein